MPAVRYFVYQLADDIEISLEVKIYEITKDILHKTT